MATNINTILDWFRTGKKPTQAQFWASWQSFWHKEEKIPVSTIENLQETLDDKASEVHTHTISDITGLTQALNAKGGLTSPSFTGTPTAPTASPGTNTDQIATTAFVKASSSAVISQTISDNVTNSSPSQRAVYDALALKANVTGQNNFTGHQFINSGNLIIGSTENTVDALQVTGSAHFTGQVTIPDGTVPTSAVNKGQIDLKADLIDGKIPASQLPSSSTSVFEFDSFENFPASGISGKIYIAKDTNLMYRWSDSAYVTTGSSLSLGEIATTAYRGDRGKTAYDHSQATGNPHNTQLTDISGLSAALAGKQATLTSGTNIKSVNGTSLLGNGDVVVVQNSLTASTTLSPSVTSVNTALALKANDTNVVHTSNSETIGGIKTFTSEVIVPSGTAATSAVNKGQIDLKADLVAGKIPASQLPSYVDDVLEFANLSAFPATGESGKLYIAIDTNLIYRWSGSTYVVTSSSLALGETAATAYRGDRGKTAYDHSQATGNPHNTQVADISGLSSSLTAINTALVLKAVLAGGNNFMGAQNININSTTALNILTLINNAYDTNATTGESKIKFGFQSVLAGIGAYKQTNNTAGIKFFTAYGYNSEVEIGRITNVGNWIIGASTDTDTGDKLQVNGTSVFRGNVEIPRLEFPFLSAANSRSWVLRNDQFSVGDFTIGTFTDKTNTAYIHRIYIASTGNVLLGGSTTDTGEKLQVTGTSYFNGNTKINATTSQAALTITKNGNEGIEIVNPSGGTGTFVIQNYDRTGLAYKPLVLAGSKIVTNQGNFIIDSTGLNPTDTGEKLQVNGNAKITGTVSIGGQLTIPTGTAATSAVNLSQLDLKADIDDTIKIITAPALNDQGETYRNNYTWFDYNYAGLGVGGAYAGSVISFSGLGGSGKYAVQLFSNYSNGSNIIIRTRNGDGAGTWNTARRLWHNGDFTSTDIASWTAKQNLLVSGTNIKSINGASILTNGDLTLVQNSLTPTALLIAPSVTAVNTALTLKADDNEVVHLTGNESKTGNFNISGNVGIGTTSPTTKFEVNGTSKITGATSIGGQLTIPNGTATTSAVNLSQLNTKADDNEVVHLTGNESKTGNFNISGNVGIGTTSPTAKLHVNGTGSFTGIVKVPNGVNVTDAVNKGQLDLLSSSVISVTATSLTLPVTNKETTIVFNGSSAAGWQVPVGGQYLGYKYTVVNKTSAVDVTLNLATGTFWLQGGTPTGIKVSPRQTVTIINDGTHWSVLNIF